jgi:tetratricopeptide (TPR) repeat protein
LASVQFKDSPGPEELGAFFDSGRKPPLSEKLRPLIPASEQGDFRQICRSSRLKLNSVQNVRFKTQLEKSLLDWLYDFIRLNIRRGRIFDLREVLRSNHADCLGYAKLFTLLGRNCGLDTGVVEVIIDNRGLILPHTISMVSLSSGQRQFIDFWYGSRDIRHRRMGLRVKRNRKWQVQDIDYQSVKQVEDISYLPDRYVDAITFYIEGNRSLKEKNYVQAVGQYSKAIRLYPENSRLFYNRAIAFENLGQTVRAQADYARALQDENSQIRTLATQPEEIVDLIRLDEEDISEFSQHIYLLHQGFITGRKMSPAGIARKLGMSTAGIKVVLDSVENTLAIKSN